MFISDLSLGKCASGFHSHIAIALGAAFFVLSNSGRDLTTKLSSFIQITEPSIQQRRIRFCISDGLPVGYTIWGELSDERHENQNPFFLPFHKSEWNEGDNLWLINSVSLASRQRLLQENILWLRSFGRKLFLLQNACRCEMPAIANRNERIVSEFDLEKISPLNRTIFESVGYALMIYSCSQYCGSILLSDLTWLLKKFDGANKSFWDVVFDVNGAAVALYECNILGHSEGKVFFINRLLAPFGNFKYVRRHIVSIARIEAKFISYRNLKRHKTITKSLH
jgi:hemolysin-activating ACP:hemolysin acyltransferase